MEWRDTGFVLAARRHGESALIAELLTREHGRHAGLVRGGQSPRRRALLQPGNQVTASWRGRLPEHLGSLDCELVEAYAVRFLDDPDRLAAVTAATALLLTALPEREPNAELYQSFAALLGALTPAPTLPSPASGGGLGRGRSGADFGTEQTLDSAESWEQSYVRWECGLLAALGFGLDLGRCAVTGVTDDLAYVSPRSGRAVSRMAGEPYRDKLLPLPGFLWRDGHADRPDIAAGLVLTRYFLLHHLLLPHGRQLPEARERLAERMRRPQPLV
jgi:DNA repair protein RecO (recombination protein O)